MAGDEIGGQVGTRGTLVGKWVQFAAMSRRRPWVSVIWEGRGKYKE